MITDTGFKRRSGEVMTQFVLSAERTVLRKFVNREKWIRQGKNIKEGKTSRRNLFTAYVSLHQCIRVPLRSQSAVISNIQIVISDSIQYSLISYSSGLAMNLPKLIRRGNRKREFWSQWWCMGVTQDRRGWNRRQVWIDSHSRADWKIPSGCRIWVNFTIEKHLAVLISLGS